MPPPPYLMSLQSPSTTERMTVTMEKMIPVGKGRGERSSQLITLDILPLSPAKYFSDSDFCDSICVLRPATYMRAGQDGSTEG